MSFVCIRQGVHRLKKRVIVNKRGLPQTDVWQFAAENWKIITKVLMGTVSMKSRATKSSDFMLG